MENRQIKIGGMHCQGCVQNITRLLKAIPGVARAEVSFEKQCADIAYDPAQASPEKFICVIEEAGFDVIA